MLANERIIHKRTRENRYKQARQSAPVSGGRWPATLLKFLSGAAAIGVMSLLFIFGHDWLTQCDYFRAETVQVSGTRRLSDKQIMETAKIKEGANILSINLATARKRLLALSWIAAAEIRREFPGTIMIRVREHNPMAVIDLGKPFLVNARGEIFMEAQKEQFSDLPVIKGADYQDWKSGESGNTSVSEAVMSVLQLGGQSQSVVPVSRIDRIHVDPELGVTLQTSGFPAARIHLGYGQYAVKYRRLAKIFKYCGRNETPREFAEIDLRYPDRIVASPAKAQTDQAKPQKEA